ncbi:MAG: site-2 protease family protein [Acidimicrobiia bacterium]|nr:site-2 protease family protein [Acidimicrobiia bacterium]
MESTSIRLGKIAGIPVGISWSLLVIAALFSFGLAEGRFPGSDPGYASGTYWLAATVTVVAFFASILAHELAHAVVARRHGLPVEGITLWLLGGIARMGAEPATPGAELRIAGVGPLSSAVVGVGFAGLAWTSDQLGIEPIVGSVFGWLALINLALAVFNAVPASPLDGGRVLAAVVWWRTGDRTRGNVGAAHAGRILGGVLVAYGLWELIGQDSDLGIWTMLVGWYIWQSAGADGRSAQARGALAGIPAVEAVRPDPPIVDESVTVDGLVAMLGHDGHHTAFVVREHDGVLRSVVTLDDIRRVPPGRRGELTLHDIAVPISQLTTAWATEPLLRVIERIPAEGRPEIVVYDDRMCLVGVVSRSDLARLAAARQVPSSPRRPARRSGSAAS